MGFLSSLLAWANAPFTTALGVATGFALLQMTGALGLFTGSESEPGAEGDVDAEGDIDADGDVDADGDADGDADEADDGDADEQKLFAGLGVGRVPLSIIWQTYAVSFAVAGISANTLYFARTGDLPPRTLLWTLPLGLAFGYATTRLVGGALGRLLSSPHQEATSRAELVGQTGVVISSKIDHEFGEVRLLDKTGHTLRLICRTQKAEGAVPEGREVVIVEYDKNHDRLFVAPLYEGDEDDEAPRQTPLRAS